MLYLGRDIARPFMAMLDGVKELIHQSSKDNLRLRVSLFGH